MKPTIKKLFASFVLIFFVSISFAQSQSQSYQSSIGVRLGTGYYDIFAASYKTFLSESPGAIELNLGFRPENYGNGVDALNVSFAGAYQYHFDIAPVPGLKWFVGGGLSFYNTFVQSNDYGYKSGFGMGIFPTGGADYKFANIPLAVSADIRPTIGLFRPNDYHDYFYASFGISARYTFR